MGYGQYCPVAKSAEVVGDRWTLLILRELLYDVHHFSEIERGLPGIPRSLLARRLRQLQADGILERRQAGDGHRPEYWLTEAGNDIKPALLGLGDWAARWYARDPLPSELEPNLLLLWIKRHVSFERLPGRRVVVRFELRGARRGTRWLVLERDDASVCDKDPGFDTDLVVRADTVALYKLYAGRIALSAALRDGSIELDGVPALARGFGQWFGFSPFAQTTRAVS